MVTLLNISVLGLQGRFGAMTASRLVKPCLLFTRPLQKADSAGEPRGPMMRSMWATSLPSPTRASATCTLLIFAIRGLSLQNEKYGRPRSRRGQGPSLFADVRQEAEPVSPDSGADSTAGLGAEQSGAGGGDRDRKS